MTLKPEAVSPESGWWRRHAAGLTASALGLAGVAVAALVVLSGDGALTDIPDPRLTVPFLVLALAAALAAFVRREGAYALPVAGVVLAGSALVLGWALLVALIAAITAIAIVIMSELM